jgi:hypothetical protein
MASFRLSLMGDLLSCEFGRCFGVPSHFPSLDLLGLSEVVIVGCCCLYIVFLKKKKKNLFVYFAKKIIIENILIF